MYIEKGQKYRSIFAAGPTRSLSPSASELALLMETTYHIRRSSQMLWTLRHVGEDFHDIDEQHFDKFAFHLRMIDDDQLSNEDMRLVSTMKISRSWPRMRPQTDLQNCRAILSRSSGYLRCHGIRSSYISTYMTGRSLFGMGGQTPTYSKHHRH